ncbi:MAG: 5-formyltetrahydrofolate cyclo-ligase [Nitrospirae bacterium]|nr:5-formyltetrahydrofolate cyclo-ligase [Nitrospirota bacterium]
MKKYLREKLLKKRDSISLRKRKEKGALIIKRLFRMSEFKKAESILFYASFKSEVDTINCLAAAIAHGKRVALPKVDKKRRRLMLYEIKDASELAPGWMGIPEPAVLRGRKRALKDIDVVVVPGAGFDICGNRLGYGAGYYDKLLSGSKEHITTIAFAFEEQIIPKVPNEGHDIKIDKIVTEKKIIDCRMKKRSSNLRNLL